MFTITAALDLSQVNLETKFDARKSIKIANYANLCGIKVCNHNFTTDINSSASLHFLCSIPNSLVMEYCNENGEISRKLSKNPVKIIDGYAHLPEEPGLGVHPDHEIIEKYIVN